MINLDDKKKIRRIFHTIQLLVVLFAMLFSLLPIGAARGGSIKSIGTINLNLSTADISRVEFGYRYSSFVSSETEYKLEVKAGQLTDGNIQVPLSILNPLVSGLTGMYPGTRPLNWSSWSDDYPHAWIYLFLNDGRRVEISSDSQFNGMFPWNISVWASEKAYLPDAMYIHLRPTFLNGIEALWKGVSQQEFPRGPYSTSFWIDRLGDPIPETELFTGDYSDTVSGTNPTFLNPFLPRLSQNSEIKTLLDDGYTLYDASFTLEVKTRTLEPVQYSGMLALASPGREDAVVGLATIPIASAEPVTTTLNAADSLQRVKNRKANQFLNSAAQFLSPLTFILDTRENAFVPGLPCPENRKISLRHQGFQAIWNPVQPMQIIFIHLADGRWSIDMSMQRGDPNWNDQLVESLLKNWFPENFGNIHVQDLQSFDTKWKIVFKPDVTFRDPTLLDVLKTGLPEQTIIHTQNPEKKGDYSFLKLDGRILVSETGEKPVLLYCGVTYPDYYGSPYSVDSVIPPDDHAPRSPINFGTNSLLGTWQPFHGPLPWGQYSSQWVSIALSQPGFMHALWSVEGKGVYYADGWIDGSGWTEAQRLGDESDWVYIRAWPDGEVHLFWDTNLATGGTIHVWKPAGGSWQEPEYWAKVDYFGDILRDQNGVLHISGTADDGVDTEFVYWTWSPENGISDAENISRHLGDIGNGSYALRFDSKNQLHAAWSHILEQKSLPDPITGETSDLSGVFYATRLSNGHWSAPEQVGTLAPYTDGLTMELDAQDNPLIIWQADNSLTSRIKKNGIWEDPIELESVRPPETPAEFGPGRWVRPTAELKTEVDSQGRIIAGWMIPSMGLRIAFWSGIGWTDGVDIVPIADVAKLTLEAPSFEMVVDNQDHLHFAFFEYEDYSQGSELYYADYYQQNVKVQPLSIYYDMYGYPIARVEVDSIGSVAILAMPLSPAFVVKLPLAGIPTPTSATPKSTATNSSPTSQNTPTADQSSETQSSENLIQSIGWIGILLLLVLVTGIMVVRFIRSRLSRN